MLAQIVGAYTHQLGCVEGGTAVLRIYAGVGCASLKVEYGTVQAGHRTHCKVIAVGAVPCEGYIELTEGAVAGHECLTGQNFLAGTAKVDYRARQLLFFHLSLHTENAAHTGNAKKVVTAALTCAAGNDGLLMCADLLAHAGQSIILAQEADDGMTAAPRGLDGCGQAGMSDLNVKAVGLEDFGSPFAGLDLVICRFGLVPHLMCQVDKALALFIYFGLSYISKHILYLLFILSKQV